MLVYMFLLAGLYSLLHFIWEGIIAPSMRQSIRIDLFVLRDELRRLKINKPGMSLDAFNAVQDGLNSAICHLNGIDDPFLIYCDTMVRRDPKLKECVEKRQELVRSAKSAELLKIAGQIRVKVETAARINSGGVYLYLVPIALGYLCVKKTCFPIFTMLYIPSRQLEKIMPESDLELSHA
jgi:hypothetical protein